MPARSIIDTAIPMFALLRVLRRTINGCNVA
jgi:hypothetical protein